VAARAGEVFVGRVRELGELERALEATRAGSGATILVTGEAGIGKTRLASELSRRAGDAGIDVLLGRSIDLIGTDLPYQPFVEALRPLGRRHDADGQTPGSQLHVFESTLARLTERAAAVPVLLVLEDLHWADSSTLDLVVFLAHNLGDRPVLLLGTYRDDEPTSAERLRRLAGGVRRAGSGRVLELRPLERDELTGLLSAHSDSSLPAAVADAIVDRSEGNPFFAEELLAAASRGGGELPRGLRDLLLQRVARLDDATQTVVRLAAAAGRTVGYPLLHATAGLADRDLRDSLRRAVHNGILVAEPETTRFHFRHALLAEAVYGTILPGEREELHAQLAEELARSGAASPAELAPHWHAAGRRTEAFAASVEAARRATAVFGLAEANAHLERALALWDAVPDAAELAGLDLAELCRWTAELASQIGAAARAVELERQALELVGTQDPHRAALLHVRLGEYLYETGRDDSAFTELESAVALVPSQRPSPERAYALGTLAGGLMVAWRYAESLPVAKQALMLARSVGAGEAEVRALTVLGGDLAYLGQAESGLAHFEQAARLAQEIGDDVGLERVYVNLTDALTMLARFRESARVGQAGMEVMRRHGIESTLLVSNVIEALLATGEWEEADRLSAAALRRITSSFPYALFVIRADLELGRGDFEAARAHLEAALGTIREQRGQAMVDVYLAELALWERRWTDAEQAARAGLRRERSRQAAQLRVWFAAKGLRAQAELAALARARRDRDAVRSWLARARTLVGVARQAAVEASAVTPNADGWLAQAEAEHERAHDGAQPESWSAAAAAWDGLERAPLAAYCRWRQAEALVAAGASRREASAPLQEAHAVAARLAARPLLRELELLAQRARLELTPAKAPSAPGQHSLQRALGLTPREAEVLTLLGRGWTNREIADALVISVKTAGVHVSHILRKLGAANRLEAAAIAHRFSPLDDAGA
jgi:DNA-binding CsgD family transcriptional regulator